MGQTFKSLFICSLIGVATFGAGYYTGKMMMEKEAVSRHLGAYCPTNAQFSWMGIMKPADILLQTTDCPE